MHWKLIADHALPMQKFIVGVPFLRWGFTDVPVIHLNLLGLAKVR
jgi:hypothetical protein